MPLARSNTSRSKSPAPSYKHITSPRSFLPPSHYAAAAGMPYNAKSTARSDSGNSSDLDASLASKDSLEDLQYHYNVFMPVSYPTEMEATSDSSFEFNVSTSRQRDRSSSSTSRNSSVRSKRQSHIAGLPLLEAQLLPSLRDTIDRMTRSPASAGLSPSPVDATRADSSKPLNNVRSTRSSSFSSDPPATSHPDSSTTPTSPFAYNAGSTPSSIHSNMMAPVEDLTQRSKLPTKSTLKSALRPPTPKLFPGSSPVPGAPTDSYSAGVSLKSVRSMIRRKLSTGSLSASPTSVRKSIVKSSKPDVSSPSRHARKRSCTDLGSPSPVEAPPLSDDSRTPVAPQTPLRTPKSEGTQPKSGVHRTNIPRLQARSYRPSRSAHLEDSDLEYRYEAEGRDRRKLIVANADVFPSSSESDIDNRGVLKAKDVNSDVTGPWGSAQTSGLGLGFDFRTSGARARGRRDSSGRHQQEAKQSEQVDGVWNSRTPTIPARGMRLTSYRSDQDHDHALGSIRSSNAELDEEHQRRRAALLGIVSRLGLGSNLSAPAAGESEESEYCGQEGFAISGSGEFADPVARRVEPDEMSDDGSVYGDDDEDYQQLMDADRWQDQERPRSSNCMPTFLLSTEISDRHIHGHGQCSDAYLADHHTEYPTSSRTPPPNSCSGQTASSRSPIIRNEDTNIPVPAALRRHSVYHRSPSPNPQPEEKEKATERQHTVSLNPRFGEKWNVVGSECVPRVRPHRDRDSEQSDAVLIAERSYAAAARERRAFGIPPSESVEVYQQRSSLLLSHAESNLSSVGSVYWNEEERELSAGAETLFRKLSGKEIGQKSPNQQKHAENTECGAASRCSSALSIYHDQLPQEQDNRHEEIPPSAHRITGAVREECEDLEAKRQELIRELCQTEETFVKRLDVFVQLFILPLRVQNSKVWISGVPSEVARLFDWLEDIMNLHSHMLSALQATRTAQYPLVERIAEPIRAFIPRFEVYQPYLVRLADVVSLIEQLVQDEKSDFGEFVDIQQGAPECDDWSFQMFLNEPVGRLAKYPDFFSRLLGLTPKTHPDYLSTFSLVHSTDMVIHVLNEVKVREDEYEFIKNFSTRIQGLPSSVQLATRERRLLFHGVLHLVNTEVVHDASMISPNHNENYGTNLLDRSSRLAFAINEWDARRGRSESTSSSSTGTSFNSLGTRSGASSGVPTTSCSTFFSSYRIAIPAGQLSSTTKEMPASPSPSPGLDLTLCGTPVQVFIFTDLVVLTAPTSSLASAAGDWTLLKDIGIVKILGIPEQPEQEPYDPSLIVLDVLPVDASRLNRGVSTDGGSLTVLRFIVPDQQGRTVSEKVQVPVVRGDVRRAWVLAFRQCFRYTLHSISLPPHPRYDPQLDLAIDTHQTIFSLLASGLPLPKSPSLQEADLQHGETVDSTREEREERGWWSVRFQQVFQKLQRQDMALLSVTMAY